MFKAMIFAGCLAAAFYAGYRLGDQRLDDVTGYITVLREDVGERTAELDRQIDGLNRRATLAEARDALVRAREAVAERNFGDAEEELALARDRVGALIGGAADHVKAALNTLGESIREATKKVESAHPGVQQHLRTLSRRMDELARQWE